jgi:sugar phosphate isomerase/epimerase
MLTNRPRGTSTSIQLGLLTVSYSGLWHDGPGLGLDDQIRKASELGYDAVSIETKRPTAFPLDFDADDRARVGETAAAAGIDLCAVESMSNFASPYQEERENNLAMMREVLRFADDLDVDLVKVFPAWPGVETDRAATAVYGEIPMRAHWEQDYPGTEEFRKWERCVEGSREVADWAADLGITLALQNHPPVCSPGYEDALRMVEETDRDNVGLCLDAVGYDGYLVSEYCVPALDGHDLQGVEAIDEANGLSLAYMRELVDDLPADEAVAAED